MLTLDGKETKLAKDFIYALAEEFHLNAKDHGFWDEGIESRNKGELVSLMHSELSEALEAIRFSQKKTITPNSEDVVEIGSDGEFVLMDKHCPKFSNEVIEFAAAIIRILDYCVAFDLPIADAIIAKHEFNITRPHKHNKGF